MKLYFLTVNEDLNSGLIKTQLVEPANFLSVEHDVTIINLCRVGNSYKNNDQISGVDVINIPLLVPYRFFMFNWLFFFTPILGFIYAIILGFLLKKTNSILICRSYFPSYIGFLVKKFFGMDFVFDSRSLFIEENTVNGKFRKNSLNYKMWKGFERKILQNAFKTISVSLAQQEIYKKNYPSGNYEVVPCFIKEAKIHNNNAEEVLKKVGLLMEDIIICYYGSLDRGWNDIEMYLEFFEECLKYGYKVLIISQNCHEILQDSRFHKSGIHILDTFGLNDLESYIAVADYGVVLMKNNPDCKTRLSVKFVEYLNNGLEVIVGQYVGEAVRLSNKIFTGNVVYRDYRDIAGLRKNLCKSRNKELAKLYFNVANVKKYLDD